MYTNLVCAQANPFKQRLQAHERKDLIVDAAISEFAQHGLHGGSTERIAKEAGISQPYIFKLFGSKKKLFIACVERVCDRMHDAFARALLAAPAQQPPLKAMAQGYISLLAQRNELFVLLHGFAASGDAEVQRAVKARYKQLYTYVVGASQAPEHEVRQFFAKGIMLTVSAAVDLPELGPLED